MKTVFSYENKKFLNSEEGRPIRILSEYMEPLSRLKCEKVMETVVFFGSARILEDGPLGRYYSDARELAFKLTKWAKTLHTSKRFIVCTGGGRGIMEAANRGAADAKGTTIGFNITLPHEQVVNPYVTPSLHFEFHYFFMRKLWFAYLARALIIFPGGFGTLDEMMEIITLSQTKKLDKPILIILYGTSFWKEIINFDALLKYGMIEEKDLNLFHFVDNVEQTFELLKEKLPKECEDTTHPNIASCAKMKKK